MNQAAKQIILEKNDQKILLSEIVPLNPIYDFILLIPIYKLNFPFQLKLGVLDLDLLRFEVRSTFM